MIPQPEDGGKSNKDDETGEGRGPSQGTGGDESECDESGVEGSDGGRLIDEPESEGLNDETEWMGVHMQDKMRTLEVAKASIRQSSGSPLARGATPTWSGGGSAE